MSAMSWVPDQVQVLLTERCNLRCRHCAVPAEDSPALSELDPNEWQRFVNVLAAAGVRSFVLSGGEALLRADAIALLCHAQDAGIAQTTVVTNLSIVTSEGSKAIAAAQQHYRDFALQVSIDGASAETHDWMRGRGQHGVLRRNAERLAQDGARITGVNSVLHAGNVREFDAIADLAVELGAWNLRLFPIAALGRGVEVRESDLGPDGWDAVIARLPELRARTGLDIVAMGPILDRLGTSPFGPRPSATTSPRLIAGPDGELFVCPPMRTLSLGHVRDVKTAADWQGIVARAGAVVESACHRCEFLLLCVGVDAHDPLGPRLDRPHVHPLLSASPSVRLPVVRL